MQILETHKKQILIKSNFLTHLYFLRNLTVGVDQIETDDDGVREAASRLIRPESNGQRPLRP